MLEQYSRTAALFGEAAVEKLRKSCVAVFGLGGVGGHVTEALARSGVGRFLLFDNDRVAPSNLNRQMIALHSTVGRYKTEVMSERIADIDPQTWVETHTVFYLPDNADDFDLSECSYIVDAVDTVSAKIEIITRAKRMGIPVISSMGTGNKVCPELLEVTDIYKTSVCPLARVMRRELRQRGVDGLKVIYSREEPKKGIGRIPASCAFVPSAAGLLIAAEVVKDLINTDRSEA